jgi:hypothetical protein
MNNNVSKQPIETSKQSTEEEIAEVRKLVDAGLRSVSNSSLEEYEKISGPLTNIEILVYAKIGAKILGYPITDMSK